MNEKFVRQYDYKANSNLVLPSDTSLIDRRDKNEATGEVQSLVGKIGGKMGDRVSAKKPDIEVKKPKNKPETSNTYMDLVGRSVADIDTQDLLYQPKTDISRRAYDLILRFVKRQLGFQQPGIISGAADEIIATMKDPSLDPETRKNVVDNLLFTDKTLNDDDYNELHNLCKQINDWEADQAPAIDDIVPEDAGDAAIVEEDELSDGELDFVVHDDPDELSDDEDKKMIVDIPTNIKPVVQMPLFDGKTIEPTRKEGYDEYLIKPRERSFHPRQPVINVDRLPDEERPAFSHLKAFNPIQNEVYPKARNEDKSLLVCAPTGAGKTTIALMAMLRVILQHQKDGDIDRDSFKIIYVAPIKALAQEIVENFSNRLGGSPYFLKVDELTGDHQLDQFQISDCQVIICTPEKWDIATRKSFDRLYTKKVKLVIFDEIHLLHNERGATVEALIARIKRNRELEGEPIRIIGLSATLPNYTDVSKFIAPNLSEEESTVRFDNTHRPVPLTQYYIAIKETKKSFRRINDIVYEKTVERLENTNRYQNAQILIFVHSRADTTNTAELIKNRAVDEGKIRFFVSSDAAAERIQDNARKIQNPKLKELLSFGLGIHHAGMSKSERACVEDLFRNRCIKVLVSTATLAWGVNLPARVVIIKGTQVFKDGKWTDLDSLDVTQMLGRAGRPGFDREGEGIVITQQSQVAFYMSLMNEQLPVESRLIPRLSEFINAECVIGNIESIEDAVEWISHTYLNSRMMSLIRSDTTDPQSLKVYGLDSSAKFNDPDLKLHKTKLARKAALELHELGMVEFDTRSGVIRPTELGRIAAHYGCHCATIKKFYDGLQPIHDRGSSHRGPSININEIELLRIFASANEFKDIFIRRGEDEDIQALINLVPYPIDRNRADSNHKVNALLQTYILRWTVGSSDLTQDRHYVSDNAARLVRALQEVAMTTESARATELTLDLCRKVDKRMTGCHTPLRQFSDDLDEQIINRLERRRNYDIDELRALKADKLAELLRCDRQQGEKVCRLLSHLPKLKVEAVVRPINSVSLRIDLTIKGEFVWDRRYHKRSEMFVLLVEDVDQEKLLHYETIRIRRLKDNTPDSVQTTFYVRYERANPFYFVKVYPERWFGCDYSLPVHLDKLAMPEETMINTQLVDECNLSLSCLGDSDLEAKYHQRLQCQYLNPIQTATFNDLYKSDRDFILMASAGSGKKTCAEFAILRAIKSNPQHKCAYIAANRQAARVIYTDWREVFGPQFRVVMLTGNRTSDLALFKYNENVSIFIGDPNSWNRVTSTLLVDDSKKKKREFNRIMRDIRLFIFDDIHLLHQDKKSQLEWLCSKIRFFTKQTEARIVALGSPVMCINSIRRWLALAAGREPIVYSYSPKIRPVNLNISIQRYRYHDYRLRLLTMQRPVYNTIRQRANARDRTVLVFVPDLHQLEQTLESLKRYHRRDREETLMQLRHGKTLGSIDDSLAPTYNWEFGYIHGGMRYEDIRKMEQTFSDRASRMKVLLVTAEMCWSLQCRSYLTIIMDTQYQNERTSMDYELTDVMQMAGLTGRSSDHECECVIMCHFSKAAYFEKFIEAPLSIESELPSNLATLVNYEIAAKALTDMQEDLYKVFLAHSFFYKRVQVNPNYYGIIIPDDNEQKKKALMEYFETLGNDVVSDLEKAGFIEVGDKTEVSSEDYARVALEHYVSFETAVSFKDWLVDTESERELIELIASQTEEFKTIPVRGGDVPQLIAMNKRHKVESDINRLLTHSAKVKLILFSHREKTRRQDEQSRDVLMGELIQDSHYIISMSHRLLMTLVDMAWLSDNFYLARTSLRLAKRLLPFSKIIEPNLEVDFIPKREHSEANTTVNIEVTIERANDPFSLENMDEDLPEYMFREENWFFIVRGQSRDERDQRKKTKIEVPLMKRIRTPTKGRNCYELQFMSSNLDNYTYDMYIMSDFYSSKHDHGVTDLNFSD